MTALLELPEGIRSKHYDPSPTAALFYEAEALMPLNGALVVTGVSGASGGSQVSITGLPAATWVSMLTTEITSSSSQLTHQGSYRMWARCYSSTGTPSFHLLWGVGSLSVPVSNSPTAIPAVSGYYLLDLGEVRLDPPPVGTSQWLGAIQAYSTAGSDTASVDSIYLQPLDEAAGELTYVSVAPASAVSSTLTATTGVNNAGIGTIAWTQPDDAATVGSGNNAFATNSTPGTVATSNYLVVKGFGFTVPSGATIRGFEAQITRSMVDPLPATAVDASVRLVKAGTIQSVGEHASGSGWTHDPTITTHSYGSPTDLWSASWAPSDVNNAGFGIAIAVTITNGPSFSGSALVWDPVTIIVYYVLASGFTVSQDAVIYANQNLHLRHDSMWRESSSGTAYGPVSNVIGDLCRLAPSGVENRPCQLFVKPSRGDLNSLPDSGLDAFTVQACYQPTWIFRP